MFTVTYTIPRNEATPKMAKILNEAACISGFKLNTAVEKATAPSSDEESKRYTEYQFMLVDLHDSISYLMAKSLELGMAIQQGIYNHLP